MEEARSFTDIWSPRVLSLLRIVTGLLFAQHGAQKVLGFPVPAMVPFDLFSKIGVAGALELFGGMLIVLGLFTRPVAFLLSGEMAVAYFTAHAKMGFWPLVNHGELAVLYCFIFLFLSTAGGGAWSLDTLVRKGKVGSGS